MSRQVFDKRTLRRKYGAAFCGAIADAQQAGTFLDEIAATLRGEPTPSPEDEPVQVRGVPDAALRTFAN